MVTLDEAVGISGYKMREYSPWDYYYYGIVGPSTYTLKVQSVYKISLGNLVYYVR